MKFLAFAAGLMLALTGTFCASAAEADPLGLGRQHDPWGRYQPGAWTLVRVTTETFDDGKTLESITETRTTLTEVNERGITLNMEVGVKFGGKEIETAPQTVSQGFHGDLSSSEPVVIDLGEDEVLIENRGVPCRILQLEFSRPVGRKVTKIFYSDTVEPHVLRRETAIYPEDSEIPTSETTLQVVSLSVPCRVFRNFRTAAQVKSVHKDASGTTTTWSWNSSLVPGGVISYKSQQIDNEGRLVRRSDLQLLEYGLEESSQRGGPFWRWRRSRVRST